MEIRSAVLVLFTRLDGMTKLFYWALSKHPKNQMMEILKTLPS
jgi:hypothetical protein